MHMNVPVLVAFSWPPPLWWLMCDVCYPRNCSPCTSNGKDDGILRTSRRFFLHVTHLDAMIAYPATKVASSEIEQPVR